MIRTSFVPPRPIRELRDLTRRRKQLLNDATSERNRVQKTLEDAKRQAGQRTLRCFWGIRSTHVGSPAGGTWQPAGTC
jgi:hypothetical protein